MNTEGKAKPCVVLVAFYNKKALGVRYLETALKQAGYTVRIVFYKDFNSVRPSQTTERELELLRAHVQQHQPVLIGLSVMSSMYLDTVYRVLDSLRTSFQTPIVCGGAFASLFPEHFLCRGADFVLRADGERSICQLADAVTAGTSCAEIPSLSYLRDGGCVSNPIGNISRDLDAYGIPAVDSRLACLIENDQLIPGDPQLSTRSYEIIASRGCPFRCSYCSCSNLLQLLPKGVPHVRFRSVESVIEELKRAKQAIKKLVFVHFYDEIFPNAPAWVDAFCRAYKEEIRLPFTLWSHPRMLNPDMLRKLKSAGLVEVIMGIQSGSERIRREVFHRNETQEEILRAVQDIRNAGIFWSSFDFMLQHPFETLEDLQATYWLIKQFRPPYELQLHGLNFLPGTDIVPMAVEQGYYTQEEMDGILYAPMEQQFSMYWKRETSRESQAWYQMIYCWQFSVFRHKLEQFEHDPLQHEDELRQMYQRAQQLAKLRYLHKKGRIVLRRYAAV